MGATEKYIGYIISHLSGKITKTQLVKLLYLIDVEAVKYLGKQLTEIRWRFHHYGPYDKELKKRLKVLELNGLIAEKQLSKKSKPDETYFLYTYTGDREKIIDPDASQKQIVDTIISQFGSFTLNSLLNYVYNTEPMKRAKRGEFIDLKKIVNAAPSS